MKNSVSFLFTLKSLLILMSWFSSDMPADRTIKITKFEWTLHLKLKLIVPWLQRCLSKICSYSICKRNKKNSLSILIVCYFLTIFSKDDSLFKVFRAKGKICMKTSPYEFNILQRDLKEQKNKQTNVLIKNSFK